jgi:SET domain-containing protein
MLIESPRKVEIRNSPGKGRGVFATEAILAGEVIEVCPVLVLPTDPMMDNFILIDYRFSYPCKPKSEMRPGELRYVIPLGYGSIYNHDDSNNAIWRQHAEYDALEFYAIRDISPGEEICTRYTKSGAYFENRPYLEKI